MEFLWQYVIPDSLLFDIFTLLDVRSVGRVAQVCQRWRQVAMDDLLWHKLAKHIFKIKGPLAPKKRLWHDEVKRLMYHIPKVCTQTIHRHTDEVLDVSISHNGQYFCTSSKDALVILWQLAVPSEVVSIFDTDKELKWQLTQYSIFSADNALVLVCGMRRYDTEFYRAGSGAVFTVPALDLVCMVEMDPPTQFGAWLSDRMFLGGWTGRLPDMIDIQVFTVTPEEISEPLVRRFSAEDFSNNHLSFNKIGQCLFTIQGSRYHLMNLLVADVSIPNYDRPKVKRLYHQDRYDLTNHKVCVIFVTGSHDAIAVHKVNGEILQRINGQIDSRERYTNDLEEHAIKVDKPDHLFMLNNCYITGMCLSHDKLHLFYNFREIDKAWLANQSDIVNGDLLVSDKVFAQNLRIGCIDLVSMTTVKDMEFSSHIGLSVYPAWYICLDACQHYVASGSEDMAAYLWDRHYQILLVQLHHLPEETRKTELPRIEQTGSSVVNGVAFSPVDQETCITVCDDQLIKIWRSQNRIKCFNLAKQTKYVVTNVTADEK